MSRPRRDRSTGAASENAPRASRTPISAASPPSRRRLWLFRIGALALSPILFFVLLEAGLRLAGFGYPTAFFLPARVQGRDVSVENDRYQRRFFGPELTRKPVPFAISTLKDPGAIRVFVFGESAAGGDPKEEFGLARMLEALLGQRYPGTRFEVVNVAMVAINSHVIREIAQDCTRQQGDVWVIYMGNNEVVGPYGAGTVFGLKTPPLPIIRASLALKATRTGQAIETFLHRFAPARSSKESWGGMRMFVKNQVRQDDPGMAVVYSHFERNLGDIVDLGRSSGARIVVSTVASNLKDCAPFASLHRQTLSAAELARWEELYHQATAAEQAGQMAGAADLFRQASAIDDRFAELHFHWGRCALALGQEAEAGRQFTMARDQDALRFRADSRINEIIRQTASARAPEGVLFADGLEALAQSSPQGLTGQEFLYEHVHLTFEGNYLLARSIAEQVARALPEAVSRRVPDGQPWPTMADCARRLAWTDWNRYQAETDILQRLGDPPFTMQFNHAEVLESLRRQLQRLLPATQPAGVRDAAARTRDALAMAPDDWFLLKNQALLQQAAGDVAGARESWRRVSQLLPGSPDAWLQLGAVSALEGRNDEVIAAAQEALRLDPASSGAWFLKGQALARQNKNREAMRCFERALELDPRLSLAHWALGQLLETAGQAEEAHQQFRQALDQRTASVDTLNTLGKLCFDRGWFSEAATNYAVLLQLNPADARACVELGLCLRKLGQPAEAERQFREAIRLNPGFANAHFLLGVVLSGRHDNAAALEEFSQAVQLRPEWMEARLNLGIVLMDLHRDEESAAAFKEVLARNATNALAMKGLQMLGSRNPLPPLK